MFYICCYKLLKFMNMKCEHKNCTREATVSNSQYFEGKWYCTYHANKATKEGRRKRKCGKRSK